MIRLKLSPAPVAVTTPKLLAPVAGVAELIGDLIESQIGVTQQFRKPALATIFAHRLETFALIGQSPLQRSRPDTELASDRFEPKASGISHQCDFDATDPVVLGRFGIVRQHSARVRSQMFGEARLGPGNGVPEQTPQ